MNLLQRIRHGSPESPALTNGYFSNSQGHALITREHRADPVVLDRLMDSIHVDLLERKERVIAVAQGPLEFNVAVAQARAVQEDRERTFDALPQNFHNAYLLLKNMDDTLDSGDLQELRKLLKNRSSVRVIASAGTMEDYPHELKGNQDFHQMLVWEQERKAFLEIRANKEVRP